MVYALATVSEMVGGLGKYRLVRLCDGFLIPTGWDCVLFVRMAKIWEGMVFFTEFISRIYIAGWSMRRMSVVGHLTAYRSVRFVELSFGGLFAFVCDWVVPLLAKVNCVEACRKL
jgi:hypothetical protein